MTGRSNAKFVSRHVCETCGRPYNDLAHKEGIQLSFDRLSFQGKHVDLTPRYVDIVSTYLQAFPMIVSNERLFSVVWGNSSDIENKSVDVFICQLRKKLRKIGLDLKRNYGVGRRWVIL